MPLELVPETTEQAAAKPRLAAWPSPINLAELATREPEPPRFIIRDWLPVGYATLLAGHGGIGKSGIALDMAVCIAAGLPFFGIPAQRRRVLYLSCEDREGVLHWRLHRLCNHLGISLASLVDHLDILDLVGHRTILWQQGELPAFFELAERMQDRQVLIVDGVSDTFGGNENSRSEVKAYINALLSLVPPQEGALVLIGHVAKPAASSGATSEGYSGSTGWHNGVRARWYLYPEMARGDESERPTRTGNLLLELQKSNLGPTDGLIRLRWDDGGGLFTGELEVPESTFDRRIRERQEQDGVLAAFAGTADPVPAAMTGPRTSFHVLSVHPDFPSSLLSGKPGKRRFWAHIESLRAMGAITEEFITREDRHKVRVYVATGKGCGHAGNATYIADTDAPHAAHAGMRAMPQGGYRGSAHPQPHSAVNYSSPTNTVDELEAGL